MSDELEAQAAWVRVMPRTCPRCGRRLFQCRRDCSMRVGIRRAHADDRDWFERHPEATKRVRRRTVEEQLGQFITSGTVLSELAQIVRTGRWYTEKGRPIHEILQTCGV